MSIDRVVSQLRDAGCVFAEEEATLLRAEAGSTTRLAALVGRRVAGEPLEHILGWARFEGLRVAVGAGVFVPRRRSRVLVWAALDALAALAPQGERIVVDLCCGSGAIGAAIAAAAPAAQVWASDIDSTAVAVARRNLPPERVVQGDLFDALPPDLAGRVAVVVANAPYVPTGELDFMPSEARDHEPVRALDGGPDGLAWHRRIAQAAPAWLQAGGTLAIETSRRQAAATTAALAASAFTTGMVRDEEVDGTAVVGILGS